MRVFISVDLEGVAGVVHREQTGQSGRGYEQARKLMANEANAAIEGALRAGATEIIVNDSHGAMRNIDPESLRREAYLISGSPKRLGMMEGIDEHFDAALFIGYHTKAGTNGVLSHTYSSRVVRSLRLNGSEIGEFGLNALVAGYFNVPVVFVSGCNLLVEEAQSHIPNIYFAAVKRSVNRVTAQSLHPSAACQLITDRVQEALQKPTLITPLRLEDAAPLDFTLEFQNSLFADAAGTLPFVNRSGDCSVQFTSDDVVTGFLILRSLLMMARSVS